MKDLNKEIVSMLQESGQRIAQRAANTAFEFWQRKDFRLYVKFATLNQTEQDRMFNELEVSVLGLFMLQYDYGIATAPKEHAIVIKELQRATPEAFLQIFRDAGVEGKYIKIWQKLIDMRLKEYREDLKTAHAASEGMKEFADDENLRVTWERIETITIDCLTHIRRGDVKEDDPLWKLLRKWFITVDTTLSPLIHMAQGEKVGEN